MNTVRLLGRLSVALLLVIFFEGLMTLGLAFNPATYSTPFAWIVQILILISTVWFVGEWHNEQTNTQS